MLRRRDKIERAVPSALLCGTALRTILLGKSFILDITIAGLLLEILSLKQVFLGGKVHDNLTPSKNPFLVMVTNSVEI